MEGGMNKNYTSSKPIIDRLWLWTLLGGVLGGSLAVAVVALLRGNIQAVIPGVIQGFVPGFVLLAHRRMQGGWWRTAKTLRWTDLLMILMVYVCLFVVAFWLDARAGDLRSGRWMSGGIGFAGSSLGTVMPIILYHWRQSPT
jgi:hypothetical protein